MARYKGYKIPLVHLRTGRLVQQLHDAGSRIVATPEQSKSLDAISQLVVISETETPTVDESVAALIVPDSHSVAKNLTEAMDEDEDESESEWLSPQAKAAKKRKAYQTKAELELMGKFVNVVDILPPLPKKGSFKVEAIKSSQYFFS